MSVIGTPWYEQPGHHLAESAPNRQLPIHEWLEPSHLPALVHAHASALEADLPARNYLQKLASWTVAWHAAMLDQGRAAELSVLNCSQARLTALQWPANKASGQSAPVEPQNSPHDFRLLAGITMPALEQVTTYQTVHERALQAATRQFLDLRDRDSDITVPRLFGNEDECACYLLKWQQGQPWICPACGGGIRCWLRKRGVFECGCGTQYSVRHGTTFKRSKMPLLVWFSVVANVMCIPDLRAVALAKEVKVARVMTIRSMVHAVETALVSTDADQQLAGVNQLVWNRLRQALPVQDHLPGLPPAVKSRPDRTNHITSNHLHR